MTLTEFLLARIAEDEAATVGHLDNYVQRERAKCEADRRVVEYVTGIRLPSTDLVLPIMASAYADHPDYQEEWEV